MDKRKLQRVRSLHPNLTKSTSDTIHTQSDLTRKRKNSELSASLSLNLPNLERDESNSGKTPAFVIKTGRNVTQEPSKERKINVERSATTCPSTSSRTSGFTFSPVAKRKREDTIHPSPKKRAFTSDRSGPPSPSSSSTASPPRAERSQIWKKQKNKSIVTSYEEDEEDDIFNSQQNPPAATPKRKSPLSSKNDTEKNTNRVEEVPGNASSGGEGNDTDEGEVFAMRTLSQKKKNDRTGRSREQSASLEERRIDGDKESTKSRSDKYSFATPRSVQTAKEYRKGDTPSYSEASGSAKITSPLRVAASSATGHLEKFLEECGLKLVPGEPPILIFNDIPAVRSKIGDSLDGKYRSKQREIAKWIEEYLEDEGNLEGAVRAIAVENNREIYFSNYHTTLVWILLQIRALQPALVQFLLSTLHIKVVTLDSMDQVPWVQPLIHQFRFLEEVVEPKQFTNALQDIIETAPTWFQKEFIPYLGDMIIGSQHPCIAESMVKTMEGNHELAETVLEGIEQLNLGKQFLEDLTDRVLNLIKSTLNNKMIPTMVGFVLSDCTTVESATKVLSVLRTVELEPLPNEKEEDAYKHQLLTVEQIQLHMSLNPTIMSAAFKLIKLVKKDPQPLDLIILLIIFKTQRKKKKAADALLKQHVRTGVFRKSLLKTVYKDFKEVARSVQAPALELASSLLKSGDDFSEFAIEWFRWQIKVLSGIFFRQREVIDKLKQLIGYSDKASKTALSVFSRMAAEEEERKCLQEHCNHLQVLLDKMENLDFVGIAILSDLLHGLCTGSNRDTQALRNDLGMLLQKELNHPDPLIKCRGVMGVIMSIKHSAEDPNTLEKGFSMFKTAFEATRHCPRAQALFYDEMAKVVSTSDKISSNFTKKIGGFAKDLFLADCTVELEGQQRGAAAAAAAAAAAGNYTAAQFGLEDEDSQECAVNFGDGKLGPVVPALFHLLRVCCIRTSEKNDELDEISELLSCSIYMPIDLHEPEPFVLDHLIYCINWFREIIDGFVVAQNDRQLQKQVLQRVDHLMTLQRELNTMLALCGTKYKPPPCYFHRHPIPPFVKIDKRVAKKGKNKKGKADETSRCLLEWESWEKGCLLSSKNPFYFRRLHTEIGHLLDMKTNFETTGTSSPTSPTPSRSSRWQSITISQVCFVIKELLGTLQLDTTDVLIRDLVNLLPKICAKWSDIVSELRKNCDGVENQEAVRLILNLLTVILKWKGFQNSIYNSLLREALRTLAGQANTSNADLKHCRDLVAECYNFFESLSDICTRIPLAIALIDLCSAVMNHSNFFIKSNREKQAHLAYGFLCLSWPNDKHTGSAYKTAIADLLRNWFSNETCQFKTVSKLLKWLPAEVASLKEAQDQLQRLPAINKYTFHLLFHRIITALIQGVKSTLSTADSDPRRIEIWQEATENLHSMVVICKQMRTRSNIGLFLRLIPTFVSYFTSTGIPVMEHNLKYQQYTVIRIIKTIQETTRYLNSICVDCTQKKDTFLSKYIPPTKGILEKFIYSVKGMLVLNNSAAAFWMGNLINKNLDGVEVASQTSSSEDSTVEPSVANVNDDVESMILSDVENAENAENVDDGNAGNEGKSDSNDFSIGEEAKGQSSNESDESSEILENDF